MTKCRSRRKIELLTPEQEARIPEYRDKWIDIGLCTAPADRKEAEAGIVEAYAIAGLRAPKIVWCGSPLAMARGSVGAGVWASVGAGVWASVGDSVRDSVWAGVGAGVGDSVRDSVRASVRASVGDSGGDSEYGQHDAHWLAFYEYFSDVCGLAEEIKPLSGVMRVAKSAGWWLPHKETCWVSERTSAVNLDEEKRPHSATGPAIAYPDSFSVWAWHGTNVPKEWIETPEKLTPATALTHGNLEQRRAACEIIGWERILNELNARTIDTDDDPQIGELVEVELPDVGMAKFLRVTCGTGRRFSLSVPIEMKTALQANAWGYNIPEDFLKTKEFRT